MRGKWRYLTVGSLINEFLKQDNTPNRATNKPNHVCSTCRCINKEHVQLLPVLKTTAKPEKTKKRTRFHKDAVWWCFSAQGYTKWLVTSVAMFVTLILWCLCMFFFSQLFTTMWSYCCVISTPSLWTWLFFVFFPPLVGSSAHAA